MILVHKEAIRQSGILCRQYRYALLGRQIIDGSLIGVYHGQTTSLRRKRDMKGRPRQLEGIQSLISVCQVIDAQSVRQSLLGLGRHRGIQYGAGLWNGLQRLADSRGGIPLGQGIGGVFRQCKGALPLLKLPHSDKCADAARQKSAG